MAVLTWQVFSSYIKNPPFHPKKPGAARPPSATLTPRPSWPLQLQGSGTVGSAAGTSPRRSRHTQPAGALEPLRPAHLGAAPPGALPATRGAPRSEPPQSRRTWRLTETHWLPTREAPCVTPFPDSDSALSTEPESWRNGAGRLLAAGYRLRAPSADVPAPPSERERRRGAPGAQGSRRTPRSFVAMNPLVSLQLRALPGGTRSRPDAHADAEGLPPPLRRTDLLSVGSKRFAD